MPSPPRLSRRFVALALVPLLALFAACGDGDSSGDDAAAAPQTITVYSGRSEELVQPLIDDFTKATGIKVKVRYGDTPEMAAQLLEEGERTPADVFYSQDAGATGALAKADLLTALPDATMERVDQRYRPSEGNTWVGVTGRARVITYHPDLVDDLPDGVLDLVDPKFKDMVAWVPGNASFQAFVTALRVKLGEDGAREWLEAMKENGAKVYEKNGEVLDAVNSGEVPIGLINHYYWAQQLNESPTTLKAKLIFPGGNDPGALVNASTVGITTNGADNPSAQRFVDFLLSDEAQAHFVTETAEYPLVAGVTDPAGVPPLADLEGLDVDLNELDSLEASQALLTELGLLS